MPSPDAADAGAETDETPPPDQPTATPDPHGGRPSRTWPGVVLRAVVVLVVAGVGYQLVVPTHPVVRSRLARLVVNRSGVAAFPGKPSSIGEQPASTGGVVAVQNAAKASPGRTGLYVASWALKGSQTDGMAIVAFLLPDQATAAKARAQLAASQLSTTAFKGSSLVRTGQFTPPGIAGAAGSLYGPSPTATTKGQVAVTVWQTGKVVVLVESARTTGSPRSDVLAAADTEVARLRSVEPGFSLSVTRYPTVASIIWVAAAVLIALAAAFGPVMVRRRRTARLRRFEEEQARTIRVGGKTIVRTRRDA